MSDFKSLLPVSATDFERQLEEALSHLERLPVDIQTLNNPWNCPFEFLPWLAWSFSVDDWQSHWSERIKRQVIATSAATHKIKGTKGAMVKALNSVGADISVTEWFEMTPQGEPYTFVADINIRNGELNENVLLEMYRIIDSTKNARSHYYVQATLTQDKGIFYVGSIADETHITTIQPA